MGLVDDENRVSERAFVEHRTKSDHRIEDIVVIADHQIDVGEKIEADLEGTDLVVARGFEDLIGVLVIAVLEEVLDELALDEFDAVLLGVGAELLVTDQLGVGAHLSLGP